VKYVVRLAVALWEKLLELIAFAALYSHRKSRFA